MLKRTQDLRPISDHVVSGYNDGKWSAKVTIEGHTLYFEEVGGIAKLVPKQMLEVNSSAERSRLLNAAKDLADSALKNESQAKQSA